MSGPQVHWLLMARRVVLPSPAYTTVMIQPDPAPPGGRLLAKLLCSIGGAPPVRRPPAKPRPHRLRVHRCSNCDHPLFEAWQAPDAEWFVLCPHCRADRRVVLLLLVAAFMLGGLLSLCLGG